MQQEQALLEIHLALKEVQVTQKIILERLSEDKEYRKDIDDRLTKMETNWTYLLGSSAPLIVIFYFVIDWVKAKLGISS